MCACVFREVVLQFCDDDNIRCLVVPESLKLDTYIPSKLAKGKVLLFIKLQPGHLGTDSLQTDVGFSKKILRYVFEYC